MKFSVLLPTRNRLDLLKYAIETVRRQDYDNWEIIVSDNFSSEDIAGYIHSLNDYRIKYYRTDSLLPVTDNWNNALDKSDGDYVIMLGDDDCLLKGYFSIVKKVILEFGEPDFIYTNALLYAYPGVIPNEPDGFLQSYGSAPFFADARGPFWLDKKSALRLVQQSLNFKMTYTYNMQHSVINKKFVQLLRGNGPFFQSPYPDFYATNVLMLTAEKILICPYPVVTIGISPKSFGYYHFNEKEKEGIDFLSNRIDDNADKGLQNILLPGSPDRSSWLLAMQSLRNNYRNRYPLKVNYRRYRYLQIRTVICVHMKRKNCTLRRSESKKDLIELTGNITWHEKLLYLYTLKLAYALIQLLPYTLKQVLDFVFKSPQLDTPKIRGRFKNILDVFESIDPLTYVKSLK